MRSIKAGTGTNGTPLKLIAKKAKIRLFNIFRIKENCSLHISSERALFYLWDYAKNYLKEKGVEKLITQAEFEIIDTAEIDMKMGWKDMNKERKLEQYIGNKIERKKHLTLPEKICGTIYLEYLLK